MSEVWQVFSKDDAGLKVKCSICKKKYANPGSSTTNMWNHLKFKHKPKFIELDRIRMGLSGSAFNQDVFNVSIDEDESEIEESNSLISQPSTSNYEPELGQSDSTDSCIYPSPITDTSSIAIVHKTNSTLTKQMKMAQFTLNKSAKIKIDNALAYFIATNMMPYSLVEKEGFKLFVNALNPSYKLPGRKTLTESRIPSMYSETRNIIGNIIRSADVFTFTTDCWTSSSNQPFIDVTCHFINDNFKLTSASLGRIELSEDHTGENIADVVQMLFLDYEIPDRKICSIVTDYGSNMLKAVRNLNIPYVACFGHALNTAVSRIFNMDEIKDVVHKVKFIHNIFAHSWKAVREMGKFQEKFSLPNKKFPSYSKTRWWSMLELINVIIEQELGLTSFLRTYKNGGYKNLALQESDIIVLKNLTGDSYVTGSAILPVISSLKSKLSQITQLNESDDTDINEGQIKNMYTTIIEVLDQRYKDNTLLIMCTVLDPRFKIEYIKYDDLSVLKKTIAEFCETTYESIESDSYVNNISNQLASQKKSKTGMSVIFGTPENNNMDNFQEVPLSQKIKN
ncbi:E3 SUMO-protein ligase ZBED1-like [Metopolophium dirhodum]|uniref:E3 SUMO-protein ligase ZBED1-like n=1 Tax=Metopolophium dirhodum TaxID=44670 RepID=UPI00298F53C4|nr:E3 SUMO-protein ligase ZBED1-like [Metopolophium dirhodum]